MFRKSVRFVTEKNISFIYWIFKSPNILVWIVFGETSSVKLTLVKIRLCILQCLGDSTTNNAAFFQSVVKLVL